MVLMLLENNYPAENWKRTEVAALLDKCGILLYVALTDIDFGLQLAVALQKLQGRGEDGAGICAVGSNNEISLYKDVGLVNEVFFSGAEWPAILDLLAQIWFLQVRYGTAGDNDGEIAKQNAQPLMGKRGQDLFTFIMNGQFFEYDETSALSDCYQFVRDLEVLPGDDWGRLLVEQLSKKTGAFSLAVAVAKADGGKEVYIARDPWNIRPLWAVYHAEFGWFVASETVALEELGFKDFLPVPRGKVFRLDPNNPQLIEVGELPKQESAFCSFEGTYLQDVDSFIDVPVSDEENEYLSVLEFRMRCGELLAEEDLIDPDGLRPEDIDVVCGVPGTAIPMGEAWADRMNEYAGTQQVQYAQIIMDKVENGPRTFMNGDISQIPEKVRDNFVFPHPEQIKGKRIVLVDDSIVRGNVSEWLVYTLIHVFGAREVHFRVASDVIDKGCHLAINTRSNKELIANTVTIKDGQTLVEAICEKMGATSLKYLPAAKVGQAYTGTVGTKGFCFGCMKDQEPPISPAANKVLVS